MSNEHDCDTKGCTWCRGYKDGYRVGPDGIKPDGKPIGPDEGYNADLMHDDEYRRGLQVGRSDRIDQQLADGTHRVYTGWVA